MEDPVERKPEDLRKASRAQNIILLVMVVLMILPFLLAWYFGAIQF